MKENKFTAFLKKIWGFLTRFHVLVALAIIIPVAITSGRYLFGMETYYYNIIFDGNRFDINHDTFEITSIDKLGKIVDYSMTSNYQGGAAYHNYYAIVANNLECVVIYDMERNEIENVAYPKSSNALYHCNTCFFGPEFYSSDDKYPLLYISMEHKDVMATMVYRITQIGGGYSLDHIQTINLVLEDKDMLYYPNSYYDYENGYLYYSGYTKNTYRKQDDNLLKYYVFDLPNVRIKEALLVPNDAIETFTLPSETATQGGFIANEHLYQMFCFDKKDINNCPKMRVVDLKNKTIIKQYDNLGASFGVYDEFENIAVTQEGKLYATGLTTLSIYEINYTFSFPEQD